jgi:type VII secretion effector (TIGR04197 family)
VGATEIKSNTEVTSNAATQLTKPLEEYCASAAYDIAGDAPVSGSTTHDESDSKISVAFQRWHALVVSDAESITSTGNIFAQLDTDLSLNLKLGIG